jgi:hypothetical protein
MQKGQYRPFVMAEQIFLCGNVVLRQLRGGGRHSDRTADVHSVPLLHGGHAPPRSYELGEKRVQLSAREFAGSVGEMYSAPRL